MEEVGKKSEKEKEKEGKEVKVTFGDDIADPPPDFLVITFLGCFFSSLSLSLSRDSSTLSTLEFRVLLWAGGGVSFDKFDFFTVVVVVVVGFFVGAAFTGCWWLLVLLLPFTWKKIMHFVIL